MPRKPNATRPKAKIAGASIRSSLRSSGVAEPGNDVLIQAATPIRIAIATPIQYALKLPAVKPASTLSDAPPSFEASTHSRTWPDLVEVKTLINSGMIAPASVPQLMIADSFHHKVGSPPMSGINRYEARNVIPIEMIEVSQTRKVSGASKSKWSALPYLALEMISLRP